MDEISIDSRIQEIDGYLGQIAKAFPRPAECYPQFERAIGDLTDDLLAGLEPERFEPQADALHHADSIADRPIFICGQMKTGTNLMMTLLDGHPEVFVPAVGSHYLLTESKWERSQFREMAAYWMRHIIMPTAQEPFWYLGPDRESLESFLNHLYFFISNRSYDLFVCAVLAMLLSQKHQSSARMWVEKTTRNELHAPELLRRFPKALFIHNVRNPMTNLTSLKRNYESRGKKFRARRHASRLLRMFRAATNNEKSMGPTRYHIVRFEDLVSEPESTTKSIAEFLGIRYSESLLTPTENGREATSNSMYHEQRVRGRIIDISKTQHYLNELSAKEFTEIRRLLEVEAAGFGYDWADLPMPSSRRFQIQRFWKS